MKYRTKIYKTHEFYGSEGLIRAIARKLSGHIAKNPEFIGFILFRQKSKCKISDCLYRSPILVVWNLYLCGWSQKVLLRTSLILLVYSSVKLMNDSYQHIVFLSDERLVENLDCAGWDPLLSEQRQMRRLKTKSNFSHRPIASMVGWTLNK